MNAHVSTDDVGGSGYSLEQLSDYLDRGRTPPIPAIDDNAECRALLDSMAHASLLSRELVERDAATSADDEPPWWDALLATVASEVRAGRDIPLASRDPRTTLAITEGAIRGLVRSAGDSVPGVLVGSCRVSVDAPVDVAVTISVLFGAPVLPTAETVRDRVAEALQTHTELEVGAIDVTVIDVHAPLPTREDLA